MARANLVIDQGTDFSQVLNLTDDVGDPLNLFGYTATSSARRWYTSRNHHDFAAAIDTGDGTVTLSMPASQTALMHPGNYVYDVFLYNASANAYSKIIEGIATVNPAATQGALFPSGG